METRANFIVVGVLTLVTILAGLGFFVWLAQFQVNRQFDYYDVLFDDVSGLSHAADVRFNGFPVGKVASIELSDKHPGKVRARIEVAAGTPITDDTAAQLAAQGLTGVSYVSLTSGREDAPLLKRADGEVPEIVATRSVVEALSQDAPKLIAQAIQVGNEIKQLFSPERTAQVNRILANVEGASAKLDATLAGASDMLGAVGSASRSVQTLVDGEGAGLVTDARATLADVRPGLRALDAAMVEDLPAITGELRTAIAHATAMIDRVDGVVASNAGPVHQFTASGLPQAERLVAETRGYVARLDAVTDRLERDPARFLLGNRVPDYRR